MCKLQQMVCIIFLMRKAWAFGFPTESQIMKLAVSWTSSAKEHFYVNNLQRNVYNKSVCVTVLLSNLSLTFGTDYFTK